MTVIIDYGAGNLHSVKNALAKIGEDAVITGDKNLIEQADRVILPGVGAFGDAMGKLCAAGLDDTVRKIAQSGKPLLGICLGLQLMFERSEESPDVLGLGIFRGSVVRIPEKKGLKIPHIGWNSLELSGKSRLFDGLNDGEYVYFVHSYYIKAEENIVSAYTDYGEKLAVAAERENVFAVQFHPEKSSDVGMKILGNFIKTEAL